MQNLLNFIIAKYSKQEVDDDLSVCVDGRSLCGLSITRDISVLRDEKLMMLLPQWRSAPWTFFQSGFIPCKAEVALRSMELQQKEAQKD